MLYSLETFIQMLEEDKITVDDILEFGNERDLDMVINVSRDIDAKLIKEITSKVTTREQFFIDLETALLDDYASQEQAYYLSWDFMDSSLTHFLAYDERVKFYEEYSLLVDDIMDDVYAYYPIEYEFVDDLGLLELN